MDYTTRPVKGSFPPEFEAEAIGDDGLARTVLFTGPDARTRAEDYAFYMNNTEAAL